MMIKRDSSLSLGSLEYNFSYLWLKRNWAVTRRWLKWLLVKPTTALVCRTSVWASCHKMAQHTRVLVAPPTTPAGKPNVLNHMIYFLMWHAVLYSSGLQFKSDTRIYLKCPFREAFVILTRNTSVKITLLSDTFSFIVRSSGIYCFWPFYSFNSCSRIRVCFHSIRLVEFNHQPYSSNSKSTYSGCPLMFRKCLAWWYNWIVITQMKQNKLDSLKVKT